MGKIALIGNKSQFGNNYGISRYGNVSRIGNKIISVIFLGGT